MGEYHLEFKPLIKSGYYQTIIGSLIDFERELKSTTHFVKLPDEDLIALEISKPPSWKEGDWTIVLIHGLCGSHKSHYMKRLARKFFRMGCQVVRVNLRGCGSGKGFARGIYHCGCSGDLFEVLKYLQGLHPSSPKAIVSFSLGANVSLKLAGELGEGAKEHIKGVIAVGPPVDLFASARLFTHPDNKFYANYFAKLLMESYSFLHSHFQDLPPLELPKNSSFNDIDELYIAKRANFVNAYEYYYHSSSKRVIPNIAIPTKILFALDDPIIKATSLDDLILPEHVHVYKTQHGGHIGFIGRNIFTEFRWMDNVLTNWVKEWVSPKPS